MTISRDGCETVGIREAARLSGLSEQTMRNRIDAGDLDAIIDPSNHYRRVWAEGARALRATRLR